MTDSSVESLGDLFVDEAFVEQIPKYYEDVYERPNSAGRIHVQLVESHALWGNHLWNGGRWLARHFDEHHEEVKGKTVLEFGAAAGLPSIIAALNGAERVVVTDYPDKELIECLRVNLERNVASQRQQIHECGFLWGSSVDEILAFNNGQRFDILILCDLLFNHSEHRRLLKSCRETLKPDGVIWCVFSHYVPRNASKDLAFFDLVGEYGFRATKIGEYKYDRVMFENDHGDPEVRRTCHIYKLNNI